MATYEAVGAVGLTLQALLQDRLEDPNGGAAAVPVSLGHPGPERDPDGVPEAARVNLFLYQVTENAFLRNQDIPGHSGGNGQLPLSLNMHYLLTVFGSTANGEFFDETPAHRLLGSAMQVLHDHGIITRSLVTRRTPAGLPVLDSALRDEHENVKLVLRPLGLEDLSNVWTSLELSYRLSVAYEVSVVQIESDRPRRYPRPVQELPGAGPRIHTATLQRPQITSIAVRRVGDPPATERTAAFARINDVLIIRGNNFGGGGLVVRIGNVRLSPTVVSSGGDRLEVIVPDDALPDGSTIPSADQLQPGLHAVEVAATVETLPQVAVASGRSAFVLIPEVTTSTAAGRTLTLTGTRLMAENSPGQIVIGDAVVAENDYVAGSSPTRIDLALPTTLPTAAVAARVSGDLSPFPALPEQFNVSITMGSEGPHVATLAGTPATLSEAATMLQVAIRNAAPSRLFTAARVVATDQQLIVVPGDLSSAVTVAAGALANALRLSTGGDAREVYLSGMLRPFPRLTSSNPQVDLTFDGTTRRVTLSSSPATLDATAIALADGIRDAGPEPVFANAKVVKFGDQLCLLPGASGAISFAAAAGSDETTVAELQLSVAYLVRARVGGAESVDERFVVLPP